MIKIVVCLKMVPGKLIDAERSGLIIIPTIFLCSRSLPSSKKTLISVLSVFAWAERAQEKDL